MVNQISSHSWQSIVLTLRPAVFDRYVLALDKTCFLQALAERSHAAPAEKPLYLAPRELS